MDSEKVQRELATLTESSRRIAQEIHELRMDVKSLVRFKWQVIGFSICAAFIATTLAEFARAFY